MHDINNNHYRKTLIGRFLNCETSVEEEHKLAYFYIHCKQKSNIPKEETEIAEIIMATVKLQKQSNTSPANSSKPRLAIRSWRWIAAVCITVFIFIGIAINFMPGHEKGNLAINKARKNVFNTTVQDSTILATAIPQTKDKDIAHHIKTAPTNAPFHNKQNDSTHIVSLKNDKRNAQKGNSTITGESNLTYACQLTMEAFQDAANIIIEQKDNNLSVSIINDNKERKDYRVNEINKDGISLTAL